MILSSEPNYVHIDKLIKYSTSLDETSKGLRNLFKQLINGHWQNNKNHDFIRTTQPSRIIR